ncbi:hypothetical protein LEMLEM_LOCUS17169 [Lemmus lemmus]
MVHWFRIPESWKIGCNSCRRWILSTSGCVICKEECSSNWRIFWRLFAWHGIIRNTASLYYFLFLFFSCQHLLHLNVGQSTLLLLLLSCAFFPVVANLNRFHRLLLVQS